MNREELETELVALAERSKELVKAYAQEHGIKEPLTIYTSARSNSDSLTAEVYEYSPFKHKYLVSWSRTYGIVCKEEIEEKWRELDG